MRRGLIALVAVGLLFLPACDIYDMGAIRGGQVNYTSATTAVVIHDGGNLADNCVFDVMVTGGTAVALAVSPPAGAIGVVLGWTLFGLQGYLTMDACLASWDQVVEPNLGLRALSQYCAFRYNFYHYTDCVLAGWALWAEMQAVNAAIGAGILLAFSVL